MTFLSPLALLGLAVLVPLCMLHLRHPPRREVASTLLWRELGFAARPRQRQLARPALPLALLLQVLTVVFAVAALAEPAIGGPAAAPARPARTEIYVLDAGRAMTAAGGSPDLFAVARQTAIRLIERTPAGTRVEVIAAAPRPRMLVTNAAGRDEALRAVAALAPSHSPADMATALQLAAWESAAAPGPVNVTVIRARGDSLPPITAPAHMLTVTTIGPAIPPARTPRTAGCQGPPRCGAVTRSAAVRANVTIVGQGGATGALTRAFEAIPLVTVRILTPARYRAARLAGSTLLVLDGWVPSGPLPRTMPVLFVDPPTLPGGSAGGHLRDPVLSGIDDTSALLAGVDLTSMSIPVPATERIVPPAWMAPVAWTPSGPLLAAGVGGTTRAAVLAFDPARTNLPQLAAFPILLGNILQWATGQTSSLAVQPVAQRVYFAGHPSVRAEPASPVLFSRWAVLAALLALIAETSCLVAAAGAGRARTAGRARPRGAVTARLGAIALLAAALAGPTLTRPGGGAPLLLLDRSGSVAGASLAAEDTWVHAIRAAAPTVQAVSFGAGTDTDIAQAIRLGDAAITGGSASRLVLLSDGLATSGDAIAAARGTAIPVDVADIARPDPDAAVTRLAAPNAVRAGDTIPLQVTVHATVARAASVTVWRDGRTVSQLTVRLAAGDNPLLISSPSGPPGWRHFRVAVVMAGDTVPGDNALDSVTQVTAAPRLLYVGSDDWFAALLRRLGFEVEVRPPAGVPATARALTGFQGIILNDIPNGGLVPAQLTALSTAVRNEGAGLGVLGGTHSLTASWYAGTPLAAALPVTGTGSGPQGSAALELVLDRSGSMNDLAGDVTKISMSRAAALGAIAFARAHHDRLGIITFDITPHVLVPMRVMTAAGAAAADRAVAGLTANGGTNIYGALQTAAGQITRLSGVTATREMVLMTDGVSQSAYYDTLVGRLRAAGVTLTSVGIGDQVDKALLAHLAAAGGGRYYYTNNAADLPRIFAAEERRSVRPAHITGQIQAEVTASVPAVRSLVGTRVPDVGGLDATRLKPLAASDVTTGAVAGGGRYPVLAQWQYGLGRVAVWTPGTAPAWLAGWAAESDLWNDTVRWLMPGVPVPVLRPRLPDAFPGGAPAVVVDTLGNAGVLLTAPRLLASVMPPRGPAARVVLGPAGPGLYTGTLPDAGPGVYRIVVTSPVRTGPEPAAASVSTELAVGYPREYLPSPVGAALLAQVAAVTGGQVLADPASAAAWESAHNGTHRVAVWWLLTVLALAAFLASVWLRPPPRRSGTGEPALRAQPAVSVGGLPLRSAAAGLLLPERFSRCCPQPGHRSGYDQG